MEVDTVDSYWRAITVIEAQDLLLQMRIADWPNMKKHDRSKFHRSIHRSAYPATESSASKVVNTKELHDKLRLMTGG